MHQSRVAGTCSTDKIIHNICTLCCGYMFQGCVAATNASDVSHEVQLVKLHGTRRGDKITPKLVLHNYKPISSHKGSRRCNISLKHAPATFSCCNLHMLSLLHVASVCTTQVFCRCNMSLQHDPHV